MQTISHSAYSNCDVPLDGHTYEHCTFQSCRFVYLGQQLFNLRNNMISSDCTFGFGAEAANTLVALKGIYAMGDWGRNTVLKALQQIAPDLKNLN